MTYDFWLIIELLIFLIVISLLPLAFTASPDSPFGQHVRMLLSCLPPRVRSSLESLAVENFRCAFGRCTELEKEVILDRLAILLQQFAYWAIRLEEATLAVLQYLLILLVSFYGVFAHCTSQISKSSASSFINASIAGVRLAITILYITVSENYRSIADLKGRLSLEVGDFAACLAVLHHMFAAYQSLALLLRLLATIAHAGARGWQWIRETAHSLVAMTRRVQRSVGGVRLTLLISLVATAGTMLIGWMSLDLDTSAGVIGYAALDWRVRSSIGWPHDLTSTQAVEGEDGGTDDINQGLGVAQSLGSKVEKLSKWET